MVLYWSVRSKQQRYSSYSLYPWTARM